MTESSENTNKLNKKIKTPSGFILQKDVYTTNLLYENNKFPLTNLRSSLPFIPLIKSKKFNLENYLIIRKRTFDQGEERKNCSFFPLEKKRKLFQGKKLRFPLERINYKKLGRVVFYKDLCRKDLRGQDIPDDNNITSRIYRGLEFVNKQNLVSNKIMNFKEKNKEVCFVDLRYSWHLCSICQTGHEI